MVDTATRGTATAELTNSGDNLTKTFTGCFVKKDANLETLVDKRINPSDDRNKFKNSEYLFYSPVNNFQGKATKTVFGYEKISKKLVTKVPEQKTKTCTVDNYPLVIAFDGHFFLCCDSEDLKKSKFLEEHSKEVRINQTLDPSKSFYGLGMEDDYLQFISFSMSQCHVVEKVVYDKLEEAGPLLLDDNKTLVGCYRKSNHDNCRIEIYKFGNSQGDAQRPDPTQANPPEGAQIHKSVPPNPPGAPVPDSLPPNHPGVPVPDSLPPNPPGAPVPQSLPPNLPERHPIQESLPSSPPEGAPVTKSVQRNPPEGGPVPESVPPNTPEGAPVPKSMPRDPPEGGPVPESMPPNPPEGDPVPKSLPPNPPEGAPVPKSLPLNPPEGAPVPKSLPPNPPEGAPVPKSLPSNPPEGAPAPKSLPPNLPERHPVQDSLPSSPTKGAPEQESVPPTPTEGAPVQESVPPTPTEGAPVQESVPPTPPEGDREPVSLPPSSTESGQVAPDGILVGDKPQDCSLSGRGAVTGQPSDALPFQQEEWRKNEYPGRDENKIRQPTEYSLSVWDTETEQPAGTLVGAGTGQAVGIRPPVVGAGIGQRTLADLFRRKNSVLDGLCLRLDNEYWVIKNWRHLADHLKAPNDVKERCKSSTKHSPTELLLEVPKVSSVTITKLLEKLREMRRNDVVRKITEKISEEDRNKKISETLMNDRKLCDEVALLLDKDSTLRNNWRRLGQELGVSRDDLKQIGRGSNPANELFLYAYKTFDLQKLKAGYFRSLIEKFPDRNDVKEFLDTLRVNLQDDRSIKIVFPPESNNLSKLCGLLNRNAGGTVKDWKHLASEWKIGYDTYKSFDYTGKPKPTKILLEDWLVQEQEDFTVEQLCTLLEVMKRNDVREYLENEARG